MPSVMHHHNTHEHKLFGFIPEHYKDTIVIAAVAALTFYLLYE